MPIFSQCFVNSRRLTSGNTIRHTSRRLRLRRCCPHCSHPIQPCLPEPTCPGRCCLQRYRANGGAAGAHIRRRHSKRREPVPPVRGALRRSQHGGSAAQSVKGGGGCNGARRSHAAWRAPCRTAAASPSSKPPNSAWPFGADMPGQVLCVRQRSFSAHIWRSELWEPVPLM